jgi:spore coat polysaccharide biosynthesis protein SpsF
MIPIVVPARMNSQRLPGKPLRPMAGKPMLGWIVDRLNSIHGSNNVVIATSDQPHDDSIAKWCDDQVLDCYRGPLEDVARRLIGAARARGADAFVRVSGDSPLMDPALVTHAIRLFELDEVDLVTNVQTRTFPKGFSVEVIRIAPLERALARHGSGDDREHVTTALYRHPGDLRIVNFTSGMPVGDVQLSVDTEDDFRKVEWVLQQNDSISRPLDWRTAVEIFSSYKQPFGEQPSSAA